MSNHLVNSTSPYLLQHKENPVDWYPWGEEAFAKAKAEDKPVFLSVGYSTCHWCHVMAHESFEDEDVATYLNRYFIAIKVDKEERPDIDTIYMNFCQAFTGSGGWPMSIFMTPDQQPFYAGTYFPNRPRYGMKTFLEILTIIQDNWLNNRKKLLESAQDIVTYLQKNTGSYDDQNTGKHNSNINYEQLLNQADQILSQSYDSENGGFGNAPKFPTPHKLMYLIKRYQDTGKDNLLEIGRKTLIQMYRGGLYDHIGDGFSRYSTDNIFLVPHFEKMLYDNALLIQAYCMAFETTKNPLFRKIAESTAKYVLREMTSEEGGFYCAQDADVKGEEGLFYLFTPDEVKEVLGEVQGMQFNQWYDISEAGNFEGKNIPNLLKNQEYHNHHEELMYDRQKLEQYRSQRYQLHLDDKVLSSWNGLMIGALCSLYRVSKDKNYLHAAQQAQKFIEDRLTQQGTLYVSYREGRCGEKGFLDDYACEIYALLSLYDATLDTSYAKAADKMCQKVINDFWDHQHGGFYLYGAEHEALILRPKETYDGAIPSGNSMMAYNLMRLCLLEEDKTNLIEIRDQQFAFMAEESIIDPSSYAMFMYAVSQEEYPPEKIIVVPEPDTRTGIETKSDVTQQLMMEVPFKVPLHAVVRILPGEEQGYRLLNQKTTYYVCKGHQCMPGSNELGE